MFELLEIEYLDIEENKENEELIKKVLEQCFKNENLSKESLYVNIILTNPENIRKFNKQYRNLKFCIIR